MRAVGVSEEHPGGGGTPFTEPVLYGRKPSLVARARGAFTPGLPFREFYDQHGSLIAGALVEPSGVSDGRTPGWTLLVNLDRHWHLAWRRDAHTSGKSLLGFGLPRRIMGPDTSEIGTITFGPVNFHGPWTDVPLALQDATGAMIGSVETKRSGAWEPTQRTILGANGVELGHIKTSLGVWSLIEIDAAMPELLRPFIFPLEDLFRAWGTPSG
jgi:hypothetical protein